MLPQPVQGLTNDLTVQPFGQVKALGQGQELSRQEGGVVRLLAGNAAQYFNMVAPGHTRHRLQSLELKDQLMLVQSLAQLFHLLVCAGIAGGIR